MIRAYSSAPDLPADTVEVTCDGCGINLTVFTHPGDCAIGEALDAAADTEPVRIERSGGVDLCALCRAQKLLEASCSSTPPQSGSGDGAV